MSWTGTSKIEFQTLAELRLREARALFDAGLFDGAYYLGGYALECALKAVILKGLPAETLVNQRYVQALHTHNLKELLGHAELRGVLEEEAKSRTQLAEAWTTVNGWSEVERYTVGVDADLAKDFLDAIDHPTDGVFPWIMRHW